MTQAARKEEPTLTATTKDELSAIIDGWRAQGLKIGFVPTMGALHEGHLSLVDIALKKADRVIASIFVNPAQFAPHEDFDTYPRKEAHDITRLEQRGTHLIYLPQTEEIYPEGAASNIKAGEAGQGLETDFRPHFFDGVATAVNRLFEQVQPDSAVFGEKDFQQLQVIREMVAAQNMPIDIIGGPTMRDDEGLALSSRNAYLSEDELQTARQLNKVLRETASSLRAQRSNPDSGLPRRPKDLLAMTDKAKEQLLEAGFNKIDYIEPRWSRLLAAAWIGKTRLIDNVEIK